MRADGRTHAMSERETYKDNELCIELVETESEVRLTWTGSSCEREPGHFLLPILLGALTRSGAHKVVAIDLSKIEYMNSSTFSPLVKMLNDANRGGHRVVIEYSQDQSWQTLSFTALKIFETRNGRISLRGK